MIYFRHKRISSSVFRLGVLWGTPGYANEAYETVEVNITDCCVRLERVNPVDQTVDMWSVECSLATDWTVPQIAGVDVATVYHQQYAYDQTDDHSNVTRHSPFC